MSDSTRQNVMRKVQGLLAKAESSPFSAEAQAFREKAEEFMTLHAIQSFELEQRDPTKKKEPIVSETFKVSSGDSVIRDEIVDLFSTIASHCRVRIVFYGLRYNKMDVTVKMVGYPEDIEYTEMLFTSLRMSLAKDVSPSFDDSQPLGKNVKRMKEAGMTWHRIAELCGEPGTGKDGKWIRLYKSQCKEDGTEPIKANPTNYVRNFAAGFQTQISQRLTDMRRHAETKVDNSMAMVMYRTKAEDVNAKYVEAFPNLGRAVTRSSGKFNGQARSAGATSAKNADLSGGRNQAGTAQRGRALGS